MPKHTSFQAIDLRLLHGRLLPYIRGKATIDDLFEEANRLAGLGARLRALCKPVLQWFEDQKIRYPEWYDKEMATRVRPYFIVEPDAGRVAELAEVYRRGTEKVCVDTVLAQIRRIAPPAAARLGTKLPPAPGAAEVIANLALCPKAFLAVTGQDDSEPPKGREEEGKDLFQRLVYEAVLRFNECLQPVWSGQGWLTGRLFARYGVGQWHEDLFERPGWAFEPLFAALPSDVRDRMAEQEDVGGWVLPADRVEKLRLRVVRLIEEGTIDLAADQDHSQRALFGLREALTYAAKGGLAFTEWTH